MEAKDIYVVFLYHHTHHKKVKVEINCSGFTLEQVMKAMATPAMAKLTWEQAFPLIKKETLMKFQEVVNRVQVKRKLDVFILERAKIN